LLTLKEVKKCY